MRRQIEELRLDEDVKRVRQLGRMRRTESHANRLWRMEIWLVEEIEQLQYRGPRFPSWNDAVNR